uniref:RPA_interact_C domain-containing protein n=1 Tax=Angiostrongylus cantonensis TaxID=6313 RepID=A0A0K0CXJ1_ANGCA
MSTVASNRLYLYKNNERGHMIRDALKKKCAEKLREKRMSQFASRRNMECIVRETVSAEVKSDFGDLDENVLLELYESITNSLIQEQYEDICRTEEERLAADVDEFMNPSVYCPACLLSQLSVDERSAKCQGCSFLHHFDNKSTPPTQSELKRLLSEGFMTHEATACSGQPQPMEIGGKLALHCEGCGYNVVII